MMIAWVILECEKEYINGSALHKTNNFNRNRSNIVGQNDDWYRFLIYKLTSGCKTPEDLLENDVHFITFNYDVSLDHAIYERLKRIEFFQSEKIIEDFFKKERFFHMYGSIRENSFVDNLNILSDENDEARSKIGHIREILNFSYQGCHSDWGIRTIDSYNKDRDTSTRDKARKLIADAEDVYILGYGFDSNNNDWLDLYNGLQGGKNRPRKYVHFTNKDDKQVINKRASKVFFNHPREFYPGRPFVFEVTQLHQGPDIQGFMYEKSVSDVYGALQDDFDFL